ncbi:MAG: hypothetical protein ACQR33_04910 [Candidatus Saccharibacteria bacterium]
MSAAEQLPMVTPEMDVMHGPVLMVCHDPEGYYWKEAEKIEAEVFVESEYVRNEDELVAEYAAYEKKSELVALVEGGEVIGATRIISYALGTGFKTLNDAAVGKLAIDPKGREILDNCIPSETIEVGTIALRRGYRSRDGAATDYATFIYGAIYSLALARNTPNVMASFDADYYQGFEAFLGGTVQALGPAVHYMGSDTIVAMLDVNKSMEYFQSTGQDAIVEVLLEAGNHIANEY